MFHFVENDIGLFLLGHSDGCLPAPRVHIESV